MSETGRILGYIGLGIGATLIVSALSLILGQAIWRWRVERRARRRKGDLLRAIERRTRELA